MKKKINATKKQAVHFTHRDLLDPTNPVSVNLIGCGGTGSHVLTCLARMHKSLLALGHVGLQVHVFDDDVVSEANQGRQLFFDAEIGLKKAVALVNRINRAIGTNWKAVTERYVQGQPLPAQITISCVDNVASRFEIAADLLSKSQRRRGDRDSPLYWIDFGNRQTTGQVVLSTVGEVKQPASKKYHAVAALPHVTEEFKDLLEQAIDDNIPSCSVAEALANQDLFINSALAQLGTSLLWRLFRDGMITERGFFMNIREYRSQPLTVQSLVAA